MGDNSSQYLDSLSVVIKYLFSWLILMPVAVIVSGKLLIKAVRFSTETKQVLKINLKIFVVEANGGEVILGFTGLLMTFFFVALFGGKNVYEIVKSDFGVDPGQFHAICFFSSMMTVIWSAVIFLLFLFFRRAEPSFVPNKSDYEEKISRLAERGDRGNV